MTRQSTGNCDRSTGDTVKAILHDSLHLCVSSACGSDVSHKVMRGSNPRPVLGGLNEGC